MRALLLTILFVLCIPAHAIQCGVFHIDTHPYRTTVNGDLVEVSGRRFTAIPGDYDNAIITLYRGRITDQHYSFILTSLMGKTTLEYVTNETPPRVLNRETCDAGLTGFDWYTSAP